MQALKVAFDARNAKRYARALKRAREAGVDNSPDPDSLLLADAWHQLFTIHTGEAAQESARDLQDPQSAKRFCR